MLKVINYTYALMVCGLSLCSHLPNFTGVVGMLSRNSSSNVGRRFVMSGAVFVIQAYHTEKTRFQLMC